MPGGRPAPRDSRRGSISIEDEGLELEAFLASYPADPYAWTALARFCRRNPGYRPGLAPLEWLPGLAARLEEEPGDRVHVHLLRALLDLDFPELADQSAVHWQHFRRVREDEDHLYDNVSGLPLAIRRRRDGALMRLVPSTALPADRGASSRELRLPGRWLVARTCYVDVVPTSAARFDRFLAPPGSTGERGRGAGEGFARVTLEQAEDYARWVHGVLPTEVEWKRPITKHEISRTYPGGPHLSVMFDPEEKRELRDKWRAEHGDLIKDLSSFGILYDASDQAPLEWTATRYRDYLAFLDEKDRPEVDEERIDHHFVRTQGRIELASPRGARHAFRLVVPLTAPVQDA